MIKGPHSEMHKRILPDEFFSDEKMGSGMGSSKRVRQRTGLFILYPHRHVLTNIMS